MTDTLGQWKSLVDAFTEEDRLLRHRLAECPRVFRERPGPDGTLSFKDTLAHIAFWEDFTVNFFDRKTDKGSCDPVPPFEFEKLSREAMREFRRLPFGEVLGRYLEAFGAMTEFIKVHWYDLTEKERHDFWTPLRHRRQHRLALFQALDLMMAEAAGDMTDAGPAHLASKA
ncbi:MAG: hypothetical protein ABFS42_15865 [Candidatus Krumholzibacteriota bacterium]